MTQKLHAGAACQLYNDAPQFCGLRITPGESEPGELPGPSNRPCRVRVARIAFSQCIIICTVYLFLISFPSDGAQCPRCCSPPGSCGVQRGRRGVQAAASSSSSGLSSGRVQGYSTIEPAIRLRRLFRHSTCHMLGWLRVANDVGGLPCPHRARAGSGMRHAGAMCGRRLGTCGPGQ